MMRIQSRFETIEWDDLVAARAACSEILEELAADPEALGTLVRAVPEDDRLSELCEHYDILDKLVLAEDREAEVRLRLHVFLPGHFDRPHNHRWTYASRILRGGYLHHLFGPDPELSDASDPDRLVPVMVRREEPGTTYVLHHTMVHAAVADPYTVSLILRGPPRQDRFVVMDRDTGRAWWQYGARQESEEERLAKRMTPDRLDRTIELLHELEVIS